MRKHRFMIFFNEEGGAAAPVASEAEVTPNPTPEPVDTGRGVEELKASIAAMQQSMNELKAELQRKDPEACEVKPDYDAYFADYKK